MAMPAFSRRSFSRGISLLESLVAMVVLVLGVLAMLTVQIRTLSDTQTSTRRVQAMRMIEDLGERMRANPHGWDQLGRYLSDWQGVSAAPLAKPCDAQACSAGELADYDIAQWRMQVERSLPGGQSRLFLAPGENLAANRRLLGVMVRWRETAYAPFGDGDQGTFRDPVDATKRVGLAGQAGKVEERGGTVTCQDGAGEQRYTCHLQYLALTARCTAERAGTAVRYHCAGA